MTRTTYDFTFPEATDMESVRDSLAIAVVACEGIHGAAEVRLALDVEIDDTDRTCSVDATTDVGRAVAKAFMGLLTRELGENGYALRHHRG